MAPALLYWVVLSSVTWAQHVTRSRYTGVAVALARVVGSVGAALVLGHRDGIEGQVARDVADIGFA